jgi:signal transduction histidine kinase
MCKLSIAYCQLPIDRQYSICSIVYDFIDDILAGEMKFTRFILYASLLLFSTAAESQTPLIDSLLTRVYSARTDEQKLTALLALTEEYQTLNRDSFDIYGPQIKELADKSKDRYQKSLATLAYANWYYRWGWSDSALVFIEPELKKNAVNNDLTRPIYFKLARAQAIYHGSKLRFEEALAVLYAMLPEAEKYRDTLNMGLAMNTIGSIAIARSNYREALGWINKAIDLSFNKPPYLQVLAPSYINAGFAFSLLHQPDSALYFINKGLLLARQIQNLNYVATALRIQSDVYTTKGKTKEAEAALLEMMAVRKKTSPVYQVIDDNLQLAAFYANNGQIDKAIEICRNGLRTGDLTTTEKNQTQLYNNDPKVRMGYLEALVGYYKQAGRMNDYQSALEDLVVTKDSFYAANSAEAIASLETKYEVQKKENTILQQRYDLQKKNFLFYGSVILTVLLLAVALVLFRSYRKRQKLRMDLIMEEQKNNSERAVKAAEEKERVRIAADLHDNLGAYAASMASNLGYIHVPDADEATANALNELSNNSNAIISQLNDTIWALKKEAQPLTAVSDRIKIFINRIKKSYPGIQVEVKEEIGTDHQLPSSQAFHLYSILQEAINNALKHSKGTNVLVTITAEKDWMVSVEDDGIGISLPLHDISGNGLSNIENRAKEAGWQVVWYNKTNGGTIMKVHANSQ